jgi:hypothetical protein
MAKLRVSFFSTPGTTCLREVFDCLSDNGVALPKRSI